MNNHRLVALVFVPAIFFGFLSAPAAFAALCRSTDVIPIDVPDTVCAASATPCPTGYAKVTIGAKCDSDFVCCGKLSPAPTDVAPLAPSAPAPSSPSASKVGTKFLCEFNQGHCATSSGCIGSAPTFEREIGTCEGGVKCCKKDPLLEAKAVVRDPGSSWTISNPLGANADFPTLIGRVISTFLGMVGAASLLVFVYAGVRYLTAGGSEEAVKIAKDTMKYAFIGLFLIIFAYVITNFFFEALSKNAAPAAPKAPITLPTLPKP